ncbi:MAG: methyltransferase [Labilithrix sp.]|nr:methyltransferase [Labilithrix sp.]MCW5817229.1 methyltransferase [Labilithrix sp.]
MSFEARRRELEAELGEPITVDALTASWSIFQRKNGHRHSTDDLLTGWYALEQSARLEGAVDRALDLGTGIGTVGLLVLSGLGPAARLTAIEAQEISFRFLVENVRANGLEGRVDMLRGDLRDVFIEAKFPLVTGSPPYFPKGAGVVPADSQKAHARFELRGDVRDYARVARERLEPNGLFVFCFPFAQKQRAIDAVHGERFSIANERDVVPREGLPPLFTLFACRLEPALIHREGLIQAPFVVRHANGDHTPAMDAVRARFGFPPQPKT